MLPRIRLCHSASSVFFSLAPFFLLATRPIANDIRYVIYFASSRWIDESVTDPGALSFCVLAV